MNRSWMWGFVFGVVGYWGFQHFTGMGNTGRARA